MPLPKKIKNTLDIVYDKTLLERRQELLENITDDGTFLPKSLLHEDLDKGMLNFVKNDLQIISDGKLIPTLDKIISTQNWSQYTETWTFIDDDNKATYLVNINFSYVIGTPTSTDTSAPNNIIAGPQGQGLIFKLQASTELQSSTYLFTKLGGTTSTVDGVTALGSNTFYYIDSYVNVIGATTGTRLTVPVRFIKQAAS